MDTPDLEAVGAGSAPGMMSRGQGEPQPAPLNRLLLLLDLPPELLLDSLRDAPHSLRSTCHSFRGALDGTCTSLCLPHPGSSQRRLKDLTALLRRLPQLRSLDSNDHDFKTLPFLAACTALQSLALTNSTIATHQLQALASCPQLTSLDLSGCRPLLSISGVSCLTALRSLNLCQCVHLTSLAPLEHCPQLTTLHLTRGRWGWLDLGALTALTALQVLQVDIDEPSDTHVAANNLDIAPLSSCTALRRLGIANNCVLSLAPLAACTQLEAAFLHCSDSVTTLAPLAACSASLRELFVTGSVTSTLGPLSSAASLHCLNLAHLLHLEDLRPLASCPSLTSLHIFDCPHISDLGPLAALGGTLSTLSVACCLGVSDVAPLAACAALTSLSLCFTAVAVFLPLRSCPQLARLCVWVPESVVDHDLEALRAVGDPRLRIDTS